MKVMCRLLHLSFSEYFHSDIELLNDFSINISLWTLLINDFFIINICLNFSFILDWLILFCRCNHWNVFNFHLDIQFRFFDCKINFIDWSSIQTFWFKGFTEFSFFMSNKLISLKFFESCFTWCRCVNWCRSFKF